MSTHTLTELRAFERKLVAALADPTAEVWYDDFKKRNRPVAELQPALAAVRAEIAAHPDNAEAKRKPRFYRARPRDAY